MSHLPQNSDLPTLDDPTPTPSPLDSGGRCCSLRSLLTPVLILVTLIALCAASYFAGQSRAIQTSSQTQWGGNFPLIDATSAVTSEKFSIATGMVSEDSEGLFVLDHNSGLLQCSVIYPRLGKFMAKFTTNVADTLGTGGKGGKYMMVSGSASFPRSSNNPVAPSVLYVMDTVTGNYACYYIPFNNVAVNSRTPQQGTLMLLATGSANPVIDRDNLR